MLQSSNLANRLWRDELRATVALAWPLVLTNLTQSLIQSTDVVLLGWAGARTTSRPRSPGLDENATVPP